MPNHGRNINVFLMDGEADGKIKVSISNWNGLVYKIPRKKLAECRTFEAFRQSGIYFLFGTNSIYVGQAEVRANGDAIFRRIFEHTSDRLTSLWNEVVIFTTLSNTFGRTDISYLENYFYEKANQIHRYSILNNNTPTPGTVTEEKEAELKGHADYVELILNVLGYKVFEPVETVQIMETQTTYNASTISAPLQNIPELPNSSLKIGQYVYTALHNLGESGYTFSDTEIDEMCTESWSQRVFHTKRPFMKRYIPGVTDNKDEEHRYVRFKATPFTFGSTKVYISKEWYNYQRELFNAWYNSLA